MENKEQAKFSIKKRIKSFTYAFNGLKILIREEHNARMHLAIIVLVIIAGISFSITIQEWITICFAIGLVLTVEILNSAIENLSDYVSPQFHELIKKTKDLAAAAVLVSTIVAVIIGLLIFVPKMSELFVSETCFKGS